MPPTSLGEPSRALRSGAVESTVGPGQRPLLPTELLRPDPPRTAQPRLLQLDGPLALQAGARAAIRFTNLQFPTSEFGVVHADRPANDAYSQWSAGAATEVAALIAAGRPSRELFALASKGRRDFARDVEGFPETEIEGFGGPRLEISPYDYGED
jgi:hypothetical protein